MKLEGVEIIEKIVGTVEVVEIAVEEVIGVIQTQVQKMIDIGLEVEMNLEVGLEVERSGKPCTYCHKPNHDFSHCYKLARELRKLCTGEKRNKGDKEEEARLNMLSCVKNYFESEKDSTN